MTAHGVQNKVHLSNKKCFFLLKKMKYFISCFKITRAFGIFKHHLLYVSTDLHGTRASLKSLPWSQWRQMATLAKYYPSIEWFYWGLNRILVSLKIIFKVQSLSFSRRLRELPWHFSFFPCTSHSPYRLIRQPFEEQSSICSHAKEKHRTYAVSAQQPIQFHSNNLISFISLQRVWCSAEPTACCVKNHRCLINFHGVGWICSVGYGLC